MTSRNLPCWILTFVFMVILSEPALSQVSASSSENVSITTDGGVYRWRTSSGSTDFNIEMRGKIELTDDDQDIKSISDDGYLEINKTVFGSKRTIVIESLGGGKMKKEYYEGRTKIEWEPNGKEWLAEVLPDIVRSSTIGAESRVNRFFRQGGTTAVLSEIDKLKSDYVKSHYGKILLEKNIPSADIPKVITTLSSGISSDYYLSTLLKDSMKKLLISKEAADAFFKATEKIASDYYRSVVLKEALQEYAASPEQVKMILRSASSIQSDYYLSVVLTSVLEHAEVKEESIADLVDISKNISSDYYRTEVLNKALQKSGVSKETVKNVVSAVANVGSDYYKTNVFNSLAERTTIEPELQTQIITLLANSVGSDYYASVSFSKILKHQKLSDQSFQQLVDNASKLSSSTYSAEVLKDASKTDLSTTRLLTLLRASANITSEYYLTTVLQSLAPLVKSGDSSVKDAYRQAAKSIKSETYYGRALKAIE
jgi:hypothetical protein